MTVCKTTRGVEFLIDEEDLDKIKLYNWTTHLGYIACSNRRKRGLLLHRYILGLNDPAIIVDHINRNPLDNRKSNLRIANKSTNGMNRGRQINNLTSEYKGVSYRKDRKKWRAYITVMNETRHLGHYLTAKEAAEAYNKAALIYHKEFAYLNKIE